MFAVFAQVRGTTQVVVLLVQMSDREASVPRVSWASRHQHVQGRLTTCPCHSCPRPSCPHPLLPVPSPFVPPPWGKPGCAPEVAARQPWPSPSASARARRATSARRRRFFSSRCASPGRRGTSDTCFCCFRLQAYAVFLGSTPWPQHCKRIPCCLYDSGQRLQALYSQVS